MIISPNNMIIRYFDEEIDIIKEKHQVSINNQIQLEYIANSEIDITILLNGKEIKDYEIDYNSGTIQFTTDIKKQFVEVSYTAIGEWLISSAKVYTNYDNKENILETLEDLINEQYKIIESIKVIGDVQTIILQMQANIDNLMALYDAVLHNEEILKNVDERIKECIAKKDELVTAINNSIQLGNTAKAQLDSSISTANTTKTDLVNTTTTCKADINKLVTDSKSDMTTTVNNHKKTVTDFTATKQSELTSTATTCVNNVNTATTIANEKLGELNQWVQDNGDIVDLNNRVDSKQDKTDNSLNTTGKTIVGAINEINEKGSEASPFEKIFLATQPTSNKFPLFGKWAIIYNTYVVHISENYTTIDGSYGESVKSVWGKPMITMEDSSAVVSCSITGLSTTGYTIRAYSPSAIGAIRFNVLTIVETSV